MESTIPILKRPTWTGKGERHRQSLLKCVVRPIPGYLTHVEEDELNESVPNVCWGKINIQLT